MRMHRDQSHWAVLSTALVVLAFAQPLAASEEWQAFDSEGGRFSVELPSPPAEQKKRRTFPIASFVSHVYTALVGKDAFGINHTDIPGFALIFASRSKILNSTRKGFLEDANASEISFEKVVLGDRTARELVYDIPAQDGRPPLRGRAAMFFEGRRLYVFWAEVTLSRAQRDLRRFFESIKVRGKD